MGDLEKITITRREAMDPKVDAFIAVETQVRQPASGPREAPRVPLYYNPMFVYALFAGLAALAIWGLFEPFIHDGSSGTGDSPLLIFLFPAMGAGIGCAIALSDGLLSRNPSRAAHCGVVGLGIGFLAGIVGLIPAGLVFTVGTAIAAGFATGPIRSMDDIGGGTLFVLMVARTMAWTFVASGMGIGQGIALKSGKLVLSGLVGGLIGGFLGGLAFDPISKVFGGESATLSRLFGMTVIGVAVGFFTGLVESMAKDAWLYMKAGPLVGKQFVIYRDPTVLGSSPKCDIYLFKDPAIEPKHAEIQAMGTRYRIVDLGTREGIHINGNRVHSHVLQSGDVVTLGETVLEYSEREKK